MRKRRRTRRNFLDQSLFGTGRSCTPCACRRGRHPTARGWRPRLHAQGVQLRARSKNAALNFVIARRQASTADCEGSEAAPCAKPWAQDQGLGVAAFRNGNFQGALGHFLAAHALQGAEPTRRGLTNLASTYLELRQFEHGLDMAERALQQDPACAKGILYKARGLAGLGRLREAKAVLDDGLQIHRGEAKIQAERLRVVDSLEAIWLQDLGEQKIAVPDDLLRSIEEYAQFMQLPENRMAVAKDKRPDEVSQHACACCCPCLRRARFACSCHCL
jgi:tetratricopeptide (TPR) repeat protein